MDYPNNPNQWWTRARKGFMVGWEDGEERLTGGFVEVKKKYSQLLPILLIPFAHAFDILISFF